MVVKHAAGRDYPRSYAELRAWFDEDWKCLDYLDWLRWPEGFVCPHCASVVGWRLADSRGKCGGCGRRVSAKAGEIFDKTRTRLTVWFATAWRMVVDKVGVSATQVQREMELGSYQTAWVMLHRYRSVMVGRAETGWVATSRSTSPSRAAPSRACRAVEHSGRCCSRALSSSTKAASAGPGSASSPTPARSVSPHSWTPTSSPAAASSPTAGRPTLRPPGTVTSTLAPRWPPPAWPRTKCCSAKSLTRASNSGPLVMVVPSWH